MVDDVAGLMGRADLAIGAAGSTAWERCCLGLPSIVLALAANQEPITVVPVLIHKFAAYTCVFKALRV